MSIPVATAYTVTATAVIDGNTYSSAPITMSEPSGFLAQVIQVPSQGTYEFDVRTLAASNNSLEFQKTCIASVTFKIYKDDRLVNEVLVDSSFIRKTCDLP